MEEYSSSSVPKIPWYFTVRALVIGLLLVGPLALPLLWLNPLFSPRAKIGWTLVIVGATYALSAVSAWAFQYLMTLLGFPNAA